MSDIWTYNDPSWTEDTSLVGYDVEASDGSIGDVDEATNDLASDGVVVDTGFWIFGKKRMIPAGAIAGVDHDRQTVTVNMTKDEIKAAPDFDADRVGDDQHRMVHGGYYEDYRVMMP